MVTYRKIKSPRSIDGVMPEVCERCGWHLVCQKSFCPFLNCPYFSWCGVEGVRKHWYGMHKGSVFDELLVKKEIIKRKCECKSSEGVSVVERQY